MLNLFCIVHDEHCKLS